MSEISKLYDNKGARHKSKALGRGIGSGKGKTSGRGGKGQTARSGVALNGFEGGQLPLYRRLPMRGFNSLNKTTFIALNLYTIQRLVDSGKLKAEAITMDDLKKANLIKGKRRKIKLLCAGELSFPLNIEVHAASIKAMEKVTSAGGAVKLV